MTWGPRLALPAGQSFAQLNMKAAVNGLGGGGLERNNPILAELPNVGVAPLPPLQPPTIQPQGGTTILPTVAGLVTLVGGVTDFPGGAGAAAVRLRGVRAGFQGSDNPNEAWYEEDVILNGTTPVFSAAEFLRLFSIIVLPTGASFVNEGTVTGSIGGNLQVQIEPGIGVSKSSHVCVPAGWNGFAEAFSVAWAGNQPVRIECVLSLAGVELEAAAVNAERSLTLPLGVNGFFPTTDIWCRAARIGGGGTDPVDISLPFLVLRIE